MMKRNRQNVEIRWLLLDTAHADYATDVAGLRLNHEKEQNLRLSVNLRHDGTRALVKLLGPMPVLSLSEKGCILRTYT